MSERKALSKKLLFEMLANRTGLSLKRTKRVYEELYKLICEELRFNGVFELPELCKIETQRRGGTDKKMFGAYRFVEEYDAIKFKPRQKLINEVNGKDMLDKEKNRRRSKRKGLSHIRLKELPIEQRRIEFEMYIDALEKEAIENGRKHTNKISEEQLVRLIGKYTGMSLESIRTMRESESKIIRYKLMNKQRVGFCSIGKFGLKYKPYVPEHDKIHSYTKEEIFVEARDAYYKPQFVFLPAIKQEIRTLTEDNLI